MAGESPGNSEQRKSSGVTTREGRDPRLAVFHGSPSGEDGDTNTEPESPAKAAGDTDPESPEQTSGELARPRDGAGRANPGDAETATGSEGSGSPKGSADSAVSEGSGGPAGSGRSGKRGPASGDGASDSGETPGRGGSPGGSEDRPTTAFAARRGGAPADEGGKAGTEPSGSAKPDDAPAASDRPAGASATGEGTDEGKAERDRPTAVFAARGAEEGGESGAVDSSDDSSESAKPSGPGRRAGTAGRPGDRSTDTSAGPKGADAGESGASGAGAGKGDARLRDVVAAWVSTDEDDADAAAEALSGAGEPSGGAEEPKAAGKAASDLPKRRTSEPAASEEGGAEPSAGKGGGDLPEPPADRGTAVFKAVRPESGAGAESGGDDSSGEARANAAKAVDQPTTAFKTVPPPGKKTGEPGADEDAPASGSKAAGKPVDQPTTAIKAVRPEKRSGKEAKEPAEPKESEAERTSRFVPLKSADPAPRRPAAAPETSEPRATGRPDKAAVPPQPAAAPPRPDAEPALAESERTKQQPLPPLDLLAQLTNTPPPPETPIRTAVRRVKIWTPLMLLLLIVFAVVQTLRPLPEPALELTAEKTYEFEGSKPSMPWPDEGQAVVDVEGLGSLGSSGAEKPVPIASVAKVMTAYIILRDHPVKKGSDGGLITIDKQGADDAKKGADGESVVEVSEGDKITQKEAIQAIMIASANNIARQLARWDAGSEKAFVKKMNDTAKDLGMKNTTYTDPSGLREQTVSTAADQVKLGKKAMDDPLFREIVRMPSYQDRKDTDHRNWNGLVPVDGVVGIKTGTTTKAGGNLLFAAEKEIGGTKQLIIGAVLGQYAPPIIDTVLARSKQLIDAAQDTLLARTVVKKGDVVGEVDDGLGGTTPLVATENVSAVGWPGLTVELGVNDGGKAIPHEAEAGTEVGTLTVGSGPGQVKVPVALQKDLAEPSFGSKLTRIQ